VRHRSRERGRCAVTEQPSISLSWCAMRRQIRLRKEYLYRKSLEGKEREEYEKKAKVRRALAEGKPIPTEIQAEEGMLRHSIEMEDGRTKEKRTHVDDEYAMAGVRDPKVCVTTSRDPSSRLKQFAKEVSLLIPNAVRINRGGTKVEELVEQVRKNDFTDLVVLQETRGEPDGMVVCHLPLGPTAFFSLRNSVLRHDIPDAGKMSEAYPHTILHNFTTPLGDRTADVLRCLFPIPKPDTKRVVTFANDGDVISFRHHVYEREGKHVTLKEVGPRLEMQLYQIRLGTLDQSEADNEYILHQYTNSAKRARQL
jgi:U3 small nucleolar ribonucleoprotein protein IMP4